MERQLSVHSGDTDGISGPPIFWILMLIGALVVAYFQPSHPVTSYKDGVRYVYYKDTNILIATHLDTGEQYIYSPNGVEKVKEPRD